MQFKAVSVLVAFATLAAAGAVPPPPPGKADLPPPPKTLLPPHANTHLPPRANTNPDNINPANTNPANTNSANTNPANTNSANTNTNTNPTNIAPPFPGNPLPTVGASKCSTGHLQCCKSAQLPTAPAVAPLLPPLGISASSISGLVGVTCTEIPVIGAGPNSCSAQPVCCTNNSFGGTVSLGCNLVNLSL